MRTVALLLKGIWLNQDEFRTASKGGGNAKGKFLEKLSECTYYGDPEYVMVDRINTQLRHRSVKTTASDFGGTNFHQV